MRSTHALVVSIIALALALLTGCGFPELGTLTPVKQAAPNPLVGVKAYAVAPVTWNGFTYEGQPEAAWQATRTPEQRASFANDKVEATTKLLERLTVDKEDDETFVAASATPRFTLAYNVDAYDTEGKFHWTLRVLDPSGNVVDELRGSPTGYGYGFAPQFNFFITAAGMNTLTYLRARYGRPQ